MIIVHHCFVLFTWSRSANLSLMIDKLCSIISIGVGTGNIMGERRIFCLNLANLPKKLICDKLTATNFL